MNIIVFTILPLLTVGLIALLFDSKEYTDKVKEIRIRVRS